MIGHKKAAPSLPQDRPADPDLDQVEIQKIPVVIQRRGADDREVHLELFKELGGQIAHQPPSDRRSAPPATMISQPGFASRMLATFMLLVTTVMFW